MASDNSLQTQKKYYMDYILNPFVCYFLFVLFIYINTTKKQVLNQNV